MVAAQTERETALDATWIAPRLYQGAYPPEGGALEHIGFDVVVLCAEELQPPASAYPGVEVIHAPLNDDGTPMTQAEYEIAREASRVVAKRILAGKRTLVTCAMGLNRSGLVTAFTLLRLVPPRNLSGEGAVHRVKQCRGARALNNAYFVDAILAAARRR